MKTAWFALPAVAFAVACNEPNAPAASLIARSSQPSVGGISASSTSNSGVLHRVSVPTRISRFSPSRRRTAALRVNGRTSSGRDRAAFTST